MKTVAVAVLALVLSSAAAAQDAWPSLPIVPTPGSVLGRGQSGIDAR